MIDTSTPLPEFESAEILRYRAQDEVLREPRTELLFQPDEGSTEPDSRGLELHGGRIRELHRAAFVFDSCHGHGETNVPIAAKLVTSEEEIIVEEIDTSPHRDVLAEADAAVVAGESSRAMELLYTHVNRLLHEGRPNRCNEFLLRFTPGRYPVIVGVGLLRATLAAREELPSWEHLRARVREQVESEGRSHLLRGLE